MAHVVIGKCGLAAALGVPDDPLATATVQVRGDRPGGEQLRIAHHVALQALFGIEPGKGIAQEKRKALPAEQRCQQAVGGRVVCLVAFELRCGLDRDQVGVGQHRVFHGLVGIGQRGQQCVGMFLAEVVELRLAVGGGGVERALHRLGLAVVVLHVVGERHQLDQVEEVTELRVGMAAGHALALLQHSARVHGLLDLDERQWHAVDQQGDVGTEFVLAIDERQLGDDMPAVVGQVFEIEQAHSAARGQQLVEDAAEILARQRQLDLVDQGRDVRTLQRGVDAQDGVGKDLGEQVVARIPLRGLQRQVAVAQPCQMQQRGNLDPGIFVERGHAVSPIHAGISRCACSTRQMSTCVSRSR